jgi:hypothetical protein
MEARCGRPSLAHLPRCAADVQVELVATPPGVTLRVGARFTLREAPLRIGPSREARVSIGQNAGDLLLTQRSDGAYLEVEAPPLRCSLNGVELSSASVTSLTDGDWLYVHPGLVLRVQDGPRVSVRDADLERALRRQGDVATWHVYRDRLEEGGDSLARWMGLEARTAAQLRQALGPLADTARGGLLESSWNSMGLLETLTLVRQAVVGAPGLAWHLEQLARVDVARFLKRVTIALFAGAPSGLGERREADELAAWVLDTLRGLDCAPGLERVSLGFVSLDHRWPKTEAAWGALCAVATGLATTSLGEVIRMGGRAVLHVVARPGTVDVVSNDMVLNPARSDIGTAPGALVRLVGEAPAHACTVHRVSDGTWVVYDESADPFRAHAGRHALRVNGELVVQVALSPGDLIEPVAGLVLRFDLERA